MNPRELTAEEIAAWLERARRPPRRVLEALERDPRAAVRRLAAHHAARAAALRAEAERLRRLYREERRRAGGRIVAGVDEVGRGPLAGPVVAAAVILAPGTRILGLDDSKRLRPAVREALAEEIRARALAVALGQAAVEEIDRWTIAGACRLAMRRAVEALDPAPHLLLVDGRDRLPGDWVQEAIVKGDSTCASIAAASIVAKVFRDRLMAEADRAYPGYGFARHKGYATREHLEALERLGPCPLHRASFLPRRQLDLFAAPAGGVSGGAQNT